MKQVIDILKIKLEQKEEYIAIVEKLNAKNHPSDLELIEELKQAIELLENKNPKAMTEELHFIIKEDGKLYVIKKMPEEPNKLDFINIYSNTGDCPAYDKEVEIYKSDLQKAKKDAIEVANAHDVLYRLVAPVESNAIYSLKGCKMELEYFLPWRNHWVKTSDCIFNKSEATGILALISFSEPKKEVTERKTPEEILKARGLTVSIFHSVKDSVKVSYSTVDAMKEYAQQETLLLQEEKDHYKGLYEQGVIIINHLEEENKRLEVMAVNKEFLEENNRVLQTELTKAKERIKELETELSIHKRIN